MSLSGEDYLADPSDVLQMISELGMFFVPSCSSILCSQLESFLLSSNLLNAQTPNPS